MPLKPQPNVEEPRILSRKTTRKCKVVLNKASREESITRTPNDGGSEGDTESATRNRSTHCKSSEDEEDKFFVGRGDKLKVVLHRLPPTQRKKKSTTTEVDLNQCSPVSPTKQKRSGCNENSVGTPSRIFNKLSLTSPVKRSSRELFDDRTAYQNARRALHSAVPAQMPGRENELKKLTRFITNCLETKTSGTLYVSGPPGTGKTASISTVLKELQRTYEFKHVYVNCTAIKSSGSIYARLVTELGCKSNGKNEKDYLAAINRFLRSNRMTLVVLDEIDQLESKNQSILYTVFEWPSMSDSIVLIGIANALDLTDRILPRLQARCTLKPQLMHFPPYSKDQIIEIFTERLKQAGVLEVFSPVAIQMLAGKVAAVSGDVRRALDIGRRVVELVEQNKKSEAAAALKSIENVEGQSDEFKSVDLLQVVNVLNNVYGTTYNLNEDNDETFPLQQKIILCTLLLILKKARNKDVAIGKLHEVYRKVCAKRNLLAVDQAEFVGLCSLIETRGVINVTGKREPRLHKVCLNWDQDEVCSVLKDKQLMSSILQDDDGCLGKL